MPEVYQFHDLLRLYAFDQVRTEESVDSVRSATRRLLLWYLHTADNAVHVLTPETGHRELPELTADVSPSVFSGHGDAMAWFEAERDNLLSVVRVAKEVEMDDVAWMLPAVLLEIYARYNFFDDWINTSSTGLASVRRLRDRRGEAETLESLGKAYTQYLDRAKGMALQTVALEIRRELGDLVGEAASTNALGLAQLRSRNLDEALRLFERTNSIATEISDDYWTAISNNNMANVLIELERFDEAVALLNQALTVYRRVSAYGSEGDALRGLSHASRSIGEVAKANEFINGALSIAQDHRNSAWEAFWLLEFGQVKLSLDDPAGALVAYQRAAVLQRQLGDRIREAVVFDATGEVYRRLGRYDEAVEFHRFAVSAFRELNEKWHLAIALERLAVALADSEEFSAAERHMREALALFATFGDARSARHRTRIENALAQGFTS